MPSLLTYPGVYIEEIPSGVRTITGVATSITAFVGRAIRGPVNEPTTINSFADFQRIFGGLWRDVPMGYAIKDFYLNGGSQGVVVRLFNPYYATIEERMGVRSAVMAVVNAARTALGSPQNDPEVSQTVKDQMSLAMNNIVNPLTGSRKTAALAAMNSITDIFDETPHVSDMRARIDIAARGPRAIFAVGGVSVEGNARISAANAVSEAALAAMTGLEDNHQLTPTEVTAITTATSAAAGQFSGDPQTSANAVRDAVNAAASAANSTAGAVRTEANTAVDEITAAEVAAAPVATNALNLEAASEGSWGNSLKARVDHLDDNTAESVIESKGLAALGITKDDLFNLSVIDTSTGISETFANVTVMDGPRRIDKVLKNESSLVRFFGADDGLPDLRPNEHADVPQGASQWDDQPVPTYSGVQADGMASDSSPLTPNDYVLDPVKGIGTLKKVDLFNLLCIPPDRHDDTLEGVYPAALQLCVEKRAMLIVDPPAIWGKNKDLAVSNAISGLDALGLSSIAARNAALYFPRVIQADPLRDGQLQTFVPCGIIAGIMARTDAQRGVWKAPAGIDAAMSGIVGLEVNLTDPENGQLNPLGINCLRSFPVIGRVVWGARTMRGADQLADEYKYVPVRRLALFLEESLYRGLKWAVFEPNDEPLWSQIRLNVGAFMHDLFRQGAFQGTTSRDAYFVKCDKETTTQNDINNGIVNVIVGFSPLKPAEFVVIKIQQIAGQVQT